MQNVGPDRADTWYPTYNPTSSQLKWQIQIRNKYKYKCKYNEHTTYNSNDKYKFLFKKQRCIEPCPADQLWEQCTEKYM